MGSSLTTFAVILRDKDAVGPAGVSIILLAMLLPNVLMAPIAGQVADRFDSRRAIPLALSAMSISSLSIALIPAVWWAPFALFLTATFGTMVGAASFLILASVFLALSLRRPAADHADCERPRALDGFRLLLSAPLLRIIMVILMVVVFTLGFISVGEVFLVVDELGANAIVYGLIGALFAGGSLVSAVILQAIKLKLNQQNIRLLVSRVTTVTGFNLASLGLGGILMGIFGVREVFLAGGIRGLTTLPVLGPVLLRTGKKSDSNPWLGVVHCLELSARKVLTDVYQLH